jgi:hypothetical protein
LLFALNFINILFFSLQPVEACSYHSLCGGIASINGILEVLRLGQGEIKVFTAIGLNQPLQHF